MWSLRLTLLFSLLSVTAYPLKLKWVGPPGELPDVTLTNEIHGAYFINGVRQPVTDHYITFSNHWDSDDLRKALNTPLETRVEYPEATVAACDSRYATSLRYYQSDLQNRLYRECEVRVWTSLRLFRRQDFGTHHCCNSEGKVYRDDLVDSLDYTVLGALPADAVIPFDNRGFHTGDLGLSREQEIARLREMLKEASPQLEAARALAEERGRAVEAAERSAALATSRQLAAEQELAVQLELARQRADDLLRQLQAIESLEGKSRELQAIVTLDAQQSAELHREMRLTQAALELAVRNLAHGPATPASSAKVERSPRSTARWQPRPLAMGVVFSAGLILGLLHQMAPPWRQPSVPTVTEQQVVAEWRVLYAELALEISATVPEGRVAEFLAQETGLAAEVLRVQGDRRWSRELAELNALAIRVKDMAARDHDLHQNTLTHLNALGEAIEKLKPILEESLRKGMDTPTLKPALRLLAILTEIRERVRKIQAHAGEIKPCAVAMSP